MTGITRTPTRGLARRVVALALTVLLLVPAAASAASPVELVSGSPAKSSIAAKLPQLETPSAVLMTMDGRELWARDPDAARPMASITKMMTGVVVLERMRGKLDKTVRMTQDAVDMEDSNAHWKAGMKITIRQLLEATLVQSANGAAYQLACTVGGDETGFVRMMNQKAQELNLQDTLYVNSHGLDDPGHHSTAHDIAALARYAMRIPEFRRIVSMQEVTVPAPTGTQTLPSTNKLLGVYRGAEGVKTGWTDGAGYCLTAAAKRGNVELLAVVLGTHSEEDRFAQTKALLDWGFKHYRSRSLASTDATLGAVPVSDFLNVTVPVRVGGTKKLAVFDLDGPVKQRVTLDESVVAPVQAGQRVGTVTVYQGQRMLAQLPAVAAWDVSRPGLFQRIGIGTVRLWRKLFGGPMMASGTLAEGATK